MHALFLDLCTLALAHSQNGLFCNAAVEYGIIFWGNLIDSKKVFLQLKRITRIMTGSSSVLEHCVDLFFRG